MNPEVDEYLSNATQWQNEMEQLREICLGCGLTEEVKWRKPCYSFEDINIAIIHPFKDACALMFFKGVLLNDPDQILEKPGENSHIARRVMFKDSKEISKLEPILKAYIQEAINVEKKGLKVPKNEKSAPEIPEELQSKFEDDPAFKEAFEDLTPGRQRGYILHFSGAKQSKTRTSRIEKYLPKIMEGKGFHDR